MDSKSESEKREAFLRKRLEAYWDTYDWMNKRYFRELADAYQPNVISKENVSGMLDMCISLQKEYLNLYAKNHSDECTCTNENLACPVCKAIARSKVNYRVSLEEL